MTSIRGTAGFPLHRQVDVNQDSARAATAADPSALQAKPDQRNPQVLKAAQMYESQFLRYMLSEMRKTVPESDFMAPNQAEKLFREQLDDNYVDSWVEKGGVGMSDMIYDQIMDRFSQYIGGHAPKAPVPANQIKSHTEGKTMQLQLQPKSKGAAQPIVSPWQGKITDSRQLDQRALVRLQHENGLTSLLQFPGTLTKQTGDSVQAGESIGVLLPNPDSVAWRIQA